MYKRFFAFGCSFTNYHWATWADLIAYSYPDAEYYNFADPGAGNSAIFSRVVESDLVYRFNKEDLVLVQWSDTCRDDVHRSGSWKHLMSAYGRNAPDANTLEKYFNDPYGYSLRTVGFVAAVNAIFDSRGCEGGSIAMVDLTADGGLGEVSPPVNFERVLETVKPSYHKLLFNKNWWSRSPRPRSINKGEEFDDTHPTPLEHLEYLRKVFPSLVLAPDIEHVATTATQDLYRQLNHLQKVDTIKLGSKYIKRFPLNSLH